MNILAGTDKGLIEYGYRGEKIQLKKIHFLGYHVGVIYVDMAGQNWKVALNHKHWGPKIHQSFDAGNSWSEINSPKFSNHPPGKENMVKNIWEIAHDPENPDVFYVGTEPAAIFKTNDGGKSYQLLTGLWEHPTKSHWQGGGKGFMDPFLHTILIDPQNNKHIYTGISCAGVFETWDGGGTWEPINKGLVADYLPNPAAEVGHDPHTLKMSGADHLIIWQQNHCGIFKTEDGGKFWKDVSDKNGIANYGFALVIDENDHDRAWVVPSQSNDMRIPNNNSLCVCVSENGGKTWRELRKGLPQEATFDIVLRHAMDISGSQIVFGTNNGNLYLSTDYGENWQIISQNLSTVRAVKII